MILYHITKEKWIPSIMSKGLIPGYRRGLKVCGSKCKTVFLTNDLNKIIDWQCGQEYVNKNKLVVLHVDTTDLKVEPTKYWSGGTYTIGDFEFETDKIDPSKIIKVEILENKKENL